jgi:hypothetical protein
MPVRANALPSAGPARDNGRIFRNAFERDAAGVCGVSPYSSPAQPVGYTKPIKLTQKKAGGWD